MRLHLTILKNVYAILLLVFAVSVHAEIPDVFTHTTVGKAMRASKHGGKLVFAFVHTDWSLPSRRMLDSTFVDPTVVSELSADYENVAIDASRKRRFVQDYQIHFFPTLLVMDFNGDVIVRSKGHKDPKELLKTLAKTRSNSRYLRDNIEALNQQADNDNILAMMDSVRFYRDDYEAKNLAKNYLDKKQTDWRDPASMYLIKEYFQLDKKYLKFISKYHFKFFETYDSLSIKEDIAFHVYLNSLDTRKGRARFNYKPVKKWFRKHRISGADKLENFVKIKYLLWGRGPSIAYSVRLLSNYPETADDNVLFASVVRILITDDDRGRIDLDEIIASVKNTIKEDGTFIRYDILSLLYYKNGQNAKSQEMIETAKSIASASRQEYEPTLPYIKDIIEL